MARRFEDPMEVIDKTTAEVGTGASVPGMESGITVVQRVRQESIVEPFSEAYMARRSDIPRDLAKVKARLKAAAVAFGNKWVYSWDVNDRKNNRKVRVEGGTIKMANSIAREYGNCLVDSRAIDQGRHWLIYARFVDLETGYTLVRPYQQRKAVDIGMRDEQRALDIVFQTGVSKAQRNVVLNALPDLAAFCLEEAKSATLAAVAERPEAAKKWILKKLGELNVDRRRVEAIYGRSADHWTVPDMAKIVAEIESVDEGMMNAEDVWPEQEAESKPESGAKPKQATIAQPAEEPAKPVKRRQEQEAEQLTTVVNEDGELLGGVPKRDYEDGEPVDLGGTLYYVLSTSEDGSYIVVRKLQAISTPKPQAGGQAGAAENQPSAAESQAGAAENGNPQAPKRRLFGKGGAPK